MTFSNRRGASPRREEVWPLVAEGNCVAVRRGGEQPEANESSATQVNSIRPVIATSLRVKGEVQVTSLTLWGVEGGCPRFHAVKPDS